MEAGPTTPLTPVLAMAKICITLGILLCLLGLGGYLGTDRESITALIPAFFGLPLAALGVLARNPIRRKSAMHMAVVIALIGLAGSVSGVPGFLNYVQGSTVDRPAAVIAQTIMAVLCAAFVVLAVKSFIDARRTSQAN